MTGEPMKITLHVLPQALTVCKLDSADGLDLSREFYFIGRTDEELSLVCPTADVPANTTDREDGWRGFRIVGTLDFSLIGILAPIAQLLADARIGIFAVSTYNTDYVLVKQHDFDRALRLLADAGYDID